MHKTTLEQWSLLEKVVEAGSFARAAEETHRSQSSVSYNLSLLQERLGVALLVPEGRRAVLTPAGELLLNQVKPLLKAFSYVETRAATLRNGMRTRLDLVVDSIFPRRRLFAILRQFQQQYPQTQVRLTEVLENTRADAINDEADVMVLTRRQDITGLGEWLMNIDFVAVAHSRHPLFHLDAPLNDEPVAAHPDCGQPARRACCRRVVDLLHHRCRHRGRCLSGRLRLAAGGTHPDPVGSGRTKTPAAEPRRAQGNAATPDC